MNLGELLTEPVEVTRWGVATASALVALVAVALGRVFG